MTDLAPNTVRPVEPWRQRLIRSLLYGRNVNRAAKARARVGFAMLAFAARSTLRPYSRLRISRCRHGSTGLTVFGARSVIADSPAPVSNP